MTRRAFTINLTNTRDGDGDYGAYVYAEGSDVTLCVIFNPDRDEALRRAKAWCDAEAAHDPGSYTELRYTTSGVRGVHSVKV